MNLVLQQKKEFQANDVIHDRFIVLGKLDNNKHSSIILKGFDKERKNFVVIKITSAAYREKNKIVTKILQKLGAEVGVPKIIWRGMEGGNTITVTECLGPNLKKLFLLMNKQFTVATICMIAIQVLNTVQSIHDHDYVCCNIMPKEILISLHKKVLNLFITDYKQARKVKSNRLGPTEQVNHAANKSILNKFSSVNLHLGLPASKKDDLESLGYILVYFFKKGNLFERNSKITTKEEKIKYYEQQKLGLIPETFCHGLPAEMAAFMTYVKSMQTNQLTEKIDYDYLRKLFKNLLSKQAAIDNFQYDWIDKARTYNLDPNSSKNPSELTINHSPRSEAFSDIESRNKESMSPDSHATRSTETRNECDFAEVDEFMGSSKKLGPSKVQNVSSFEEKVKTISHVKRNSMLSGPSFDTFSKHRSNSEARDHKSSTTEELSWEIAGEKPDDFPRPKIKSATEAVKVSKFAKVYGQNTESSKTG